MTPPLTLSRYRAFTGSRSHPPAGRRGTPPPATTYELSRHRSRPRRLRHGIPPADVPRGTSAGHFLFGKKPHFFIPFCLCYNKYKRPQSRPPKNAKTGEVRRGKSHRNSKPEGRRWQNHHRRQPERLCGGTRQKGPHRRSGPAGQHHIGVWHLQKQGGGRHLHLPDRR